MITRQGLPGRVPRCGGLVGILGTLALAVPLSAAAHADTPPLPAAPAVAALSAILLDAKTGTVLFARAADVPRPPASTTKILTAVVAIERLRPDAPVTISRRAELQRTGTSIGLVAGERWTVADLLRALMILSANDAAVALAEGVAGSVEAFAALMNARARELGATRTTFVVPHGLDHPAHLTTARDLALIARHALRLPAFATLARQQVWTFVRQGRPPWVIVNHNRLLWRVPGADGVKTGWTSRSGPSLVASATRGGRRLIVVVLNSPDVFGESARLLEYGFAATSLVRAGAKGQVVGRSAVANGREDVEGILPRDVDVVVPRGVAPRVQVRLRAGLAAPLREGEPIGELVVFVAGQRVAAAPVVAARPVSALSFWDRVLARVRPRPQPSRGPDDG